MDILILFTLVLIILAIVLLIRDAGTTKKSASLKKSLDELEETNNEMHELYSDSNDYSEELLETINTLQEKLDKTIHQKKSSEVRLGKITEHIVPFTAQWEWSSNNFRFLGSPIDGISFENDEILFIEIKTGKSRLSKNQTRCKELVKQGKVRFVEFRVGEEGVTIK